MPAAAAIVVAAVGSAGTAMVGSFVTFGLASGMAASIVGGVVIGAVVGGITAAVTGDDILKGALAGGLVGGVTAGFAAYAAGEAEMAQGLAADAVDSAAVDASAGLVSPAEMAAGTAPADSMVATTGMNASNAGVDLSTTSVEFAGADSVAAPSEGMLSSGVSRGADAGLSMVGEAASTEVAEGGLLKAMADMSVTDKLTLGATTLQGAGSMMGAAAGDDKPEYRASHKLGDVNLNTDKIGIDADKYATSPTSNEGSRSQPVQDAIQVAAPQFAKFQPKPVQGLLNKPV